MNGDVMKNMWMVRAGIDAILIDEFKSRNIVALGWGIGDLTNKSEDDIKKLLEDKYPENSKNSISKIASQVIKFRYKIKTGDYVLSGDPSNRTYLLGIITSDYYYSTELDKKGENFLGYNDTHNVKWFGEISRDRLKKSTKNTLGAASTLFNINKNARLDILNAFEEVNKIKYDSSAKIIRDYLDDNNLGNFEQDEFEDAIKKFHKMYSPEILEKFNGVDLLNRIFLHDGDSNNLCYFLEFSKDFNIFGSISGGSAYKFTLYKKKDSGWVYGSSLKSENLTEDEAIQVGTKIRDAIVKGAEYIKNAKLNTIDDYNKLESELNEIFKDTYVNPTHSWIHKYYTIVFPDKFAKWHSDYGRKKQLETFNIIPNNDYYANDAQFKLLAEKAGIKFYSLFDENIKELLGDELDFTPDDEEEIDNAPKDFDESGELKFSNDLKRNIIYFGAPGTGKSYNLNQDMEKLIKEENDYERVTFHPDYSYANFVGTYKPVPKDDSISYEYVPGPFMRSLVKALKHPEKAFLLVIEEINRSNVAAVFGDVFQLLDRDKNNESRYSIETTEDMRKYLKDELSEDYDKIKIPSNMFIWATMNSADQGVFPMDTAFKRRWDFKYFGINYNEELISHIKVNLNNQEISWNDLRKAINNELLSYRINEDKLLGPFFAYNEYLDEEITDEEFKEIFKNKIIMYLFEDAAKAKRNDLFAGAKENNNVIYSRVCELFDAKGIEIFCDNIKGNLLNSDLEEESSEFDAEIDSDIFDESE